MIRAALLFIGALVGAGFATGREVTGFFCGHSVWGAVAAGWGLGALCALFLWFGRAERARPLPRALRASGRFVLWCGACLTYWRMATAGEQIFDQAFGVRGIGLWTGVFAGVLGALDMRTIGKVNAVVVPLLCLSVLALGAVAPPVQGGKIGVFSAFHYCAMNILLGGYVVAPQGEKMSARAIVGAGALVGVVFYVLLACVYRVACVYPDAAMPVYEFAASRGLAPLSAAIVYLAVFTTMLGSGAMIVGAVAETCRSVTVGICVPIAITVLGIGSEFSAVVQTTYPIVGYVGIVYTALALAVCLRAAMRHRDRLPRLPSVSDRRAADTAR